MFVINIIKQTKKVNPFLDNREIKKLRALAHGYRNKEYSDIIDENGFQYVDLVQEGGGVLGIALVGYTHILEYVGIRFYNLAGTSAGAINTLVMAAMGKINKVKSPDILRILSDKNLADLMDGEEAVRNTINRFVKKEKQPFWTMGWDILKSIRIAISEYGLNPGDNFLQWMTDVLKEQEADTMEKLTARINQLPQLQNKVDDTWEATLPKISIIASDITTHTKTEFPEMAHLYWDDVNNINPALFARASMSVPFFFHPLVINNIPNAGEENNLNWLKAAAFRGKIPKQVHFVDGGILSNFPINVFHNDNMPSRPTLGVRLSTFRSSSSNIQNILSYTSAMVSTMRQIHDYDFILKNPDYKCLICNIDADKDFNWLNFEMSQQRQIELFTLGAKRAVEFLEKFDWQGYKEIRAKMI